MATVVLNASLRDWSNVIFSMSLVYSFIARAVSEAATSMLMLEESVG